METNTTTMISLKSGMDGAQPRTYKESALSGEALLGEADLKLGKLPADGAFQRMLTQDRGEPQTGALGR